MKGTRIVYSESELAWIHEHHTWSRKDLHQAFVQKFNRTDVSQSNLTSLCKRKGWLTGRDGRFVPGQESWNKGKSMPSHPNSARTQFKKGQEPHNTKHLGHRRISKDGYVEVSVAETNPHTGYQRRYVQEHRHRWEQANGPVPEGHALKCLDGDRTNTEPSNWEAVPRGMLPRLSGRWTGLPYDSAPAELKPTIMATAKLAHAANAARKRSSE